MNRWIVALYSPIDAEEEKYYRMAFEQRGYRMKPVSVDNVLICDAVLLFNRPETRDRYREILDLCERRNVPILVVGPMDGIQEGTSVEDVSFSDLPALLREEEEQTSHPVANLFVRWLILALTTMSILFGAYVFYRLTPMADSEIAVVEKSEQMMNRYGDRVAQVWSISLIGDSVYRGSGFLVGDRHVVTNAHVVDHPSSMYRLVFDRKTVNANVVALDSNNDIALLETDEAIGLQPLRFVQKEPEADSEIYVIGYPESDGKTIASGTYLGLRVISEPGISYAIANLPLRRGNSGSPVIDAKGNVIGIASAISAQNEDVGLLVPYEICLEYLRKYIFLP